MRLCQIRTTTQATANQIISSLCFCFFSIKTLYLAPVTGAPELPLVWCCLVQIGVCSNKLWTFLMCLSLPFNSYKWQRGYSLKLFFNCVNKAQRAFCDLLCPVRALTDTCPGHLRVQESRTKLYHWRGPRRFTSLWSWQDVIISSFLWQRRWPHVWPLCPGSS